MISELHYRKDKLKVTFGGILGFISGMAVCWVIDRIFQPLEWIFPPDENISINLSDETTLSDSQVSDVGMDLNNMHYWDPWEDFLGSIFLCILIAGFVIGMYITFLRIQKKIQMR